MSFLSLLVLSVVSFCLVTFGTVVAIMLGLLPGAEIPFSRQLSKFAGAARAYLQPEVVAAGADLQRKDDSSAIANGVTIVNGTVLNLAQSPSSSGTSMISGPGRSDSPSEPDFLDMLLNQGEEDDEQIERKNRSYATGVPKNATWQTSISDNKVTHRAPALAS
jgi:hypothetical protein